MSNRFEQLWDHLNRLRPVSVRKSSTSHVQGQNKYIAEMPGALVLGSIAEEKTLNLGNTYTIQGRGSSVERAIEDLFNGTTAGGFYVVLQEGKDPDGTPASSRYLWDHDLEEWRSI